MTSEQAKHRSQPAIAAPEHLFAWVWLPGATDPVVAGVLQRTSTRYAGQSVITFTYARSFRERADAVSLFSPELPLYAGTFDPTLPGRVVTSAGTGGATVLDMVDRIPGDAPRAPLALHGCLRDGAPDAWGRRVISLRLASDPGRDLSELTYLRESGSDRIGALDFQDSADHYVARTSEATLEDMLHASELLEAGIQLPADLAAAALHGTSIGGARPKALLHDGHRHLIAKFPSTTDVRPVVKAEAVAMLLAERVGIGVASVEVAPVKGRDVLLVERFDRVGDARRMMVSALTVLGEEEMGARHSSYAALAESIRRGPWLYPERTLTEMFTRLVFNVCVGNTDDHLRNHAAFWNGTQLELTPAYDLEPVTRNTPVAGHAIAITRDGQRASQLRLCREVAGDFHVSTLVAAEIIDHVVGTIRSEWESTCDRARLTRAERDGLWEREILNEYIFRDQP